LRIITVSKLAQSALLVCITCGVLCARSRGAFVGMLGGSAMLLLAAVWLGRFHRAICVLVPLIAVSIGFLSWTHLSGRVANEYASLTVPDVLADGRVHIWRDALESARHFSLLGSGYGTYRYVYRFYEAHYSDKWAYHAENQYLEALVEGGVVGLGLLIGMIVVVASSIIYLFKYSRRRGGEPLAWIGCFALASQAVHGFVDFGLYIPANMLLFALICGSIVGRAAYLGGRSRRASASRRTPMFAWTGQLALVACTLFLGKEVVRAAHLEPSLVNRPVDEHQAADSSESRVRDIRAINTEITRLEDALTNRADDAEGHCRLAALFVMRYQQMATAELRAHFGGNGDKTTISKLAAPNMLRYRGNQLVRNGDLEALRNLRSVRSIQENLLPAVEHLRLARQACPLLPSAHLRLAELSFLLQPPENSELHLDRAQMLLRNDPYLLYYRGWLHADDEQWSQACACWQKCLEVSSIYLDQIMSHVQGTLEMEQIVSDLLPSSPSVLIDFANRPSTKQDQKALDLVLGKVDAVLHQGTFAKGEQHYYRGRLNAFTNRFDAAIEDYRAAIKLEPHSLAWRHEFAALLTQQGRLNEAHDEAQICYMIDPHDPKCEQLLRSIIRLQLQQKDVHSTPPTLPLASQK
jgi:tetratricopeptide (TPR) repeat protein